MAKINGFIKLHRQLIDWEWYTDTPVKVLFLHLLLMANYEDGKWRGITVKRGQRLTSLQRLADETGLTVQQVRTALDKLENTGEITCQATNKYTLINVENYTLYQGKTGTSNKQSNKQTTNEQQTNNKQITTNKNNKKKNNINNDKKIRSDAWGNEPSGAMQQVYKYREQIKKVGG